MTPYEEYYNIFSLIKHKFVKEDTVNEIEHKNFINDYTTMIIDYNLDYLIDTPYSIIVSRDGYFSIVVDWEDIVLMTEIVKDKDLFLSQGFLFYTLIIVDKGQIDINEDMQKYNENIFDF